MYLKNFKTGKYLPFVYSLDYDTTTRALVFRINPVCIEIFKTINPENLPLRYCREKLGFSVFEPDIEKSFGLNNCAVNHGLVEGLLTISFPVQAEYILSEDACEVCKGEKVSWNEIPCYHCRAKGKEFSKTSNIDAICASVYLLTRYLNWVCLLDKESAASENQWGLQDIFLEVDARAGIGGEGTPQFYEAISSFAEEIPPVARNEMFRLHQYIDGAESFPDFEFYCRVSEFRCEIGTTGMFYVQVPGQNGCSIHMHHSSSTEFACHNVDRPQQHLCLIVGFAILAGQFYKTKARPPV